LRYENRKDDYDIPGARSVLPPTTIGTSNNIRRVNFWTLGDVYNIRPSAINEFRAGVVILVSASSANFTGQNLLAQIGIQGLPDGGPVHNIPFFNITGISPNNINLLNPVNDGHAQFADNLSWVHGSHSMKFGLEQVDFFVNRYMPNTRESDFGSYASAAPVHGQPICGFPVGTLGDGDAPDPYPARYNRFRDWSVYAQMISRRRSGSP
jgi:hypothetical protein